MPAKPTASSRVHEEDAMVALREVSLPTAALRWRREKGRRAKRDCQAGRKKRKDKHDRGQVKEETEKETIYARISNEQHVHAERSIAAGVVGQPVTARQGRPGGVISPNVCLGKPSSGGSVAELHQSCAACRRLTSLAAALRTTGCWLRAAGAGDAPDASSAPLAFSPQDS